MEIIEVGDQFYILAKSALADDRTRVLKHDDIFAVFDRYGDIQPVGLGEQGIYHDGTRFLSKLTLSIGGQKPMLLSSTIREDNVLLAVDLSNPDMALEHSAKLPRGSLHIYRSKFFWDKTCYERLRVRNYSLVPVDSWLSLLFDSDFADLFEVRGQRRVSRGAREEDTVDASGMVLSYAGLDHVLRRTSVHCDPAPFHVAPGEITLKFHLEPHMETDFLLSIACEAGAASPPKRCKSYEHALAEAGRALRTRAEGCTIYTANEQFNHWLNRSDADLQMMLTATDWGVYPYAGVPWFSTVFGRDGIITALEYLWVDPQVARGVLRYLAANQATETIPEQDAEPGKILHEQRGGEMAAMKEIPFERYYGSIDSTPLFLILAAAYLNRTGDEDLLRSLWPNLERALHWIDCYGDPDHDGFVEYNRRSSQGLLQQGWKDSQDSIFHADGSLAEGPIALCEVQAYVYAAKRGIAEVARTLGFAERAGALLQQAEILQERFESAFWCPELSTYALALDGQKRPCRVRTSNAGHCLYGGIASPEHARAVAQTLLDHHGFSGWGIRTVSAPEMRYNPMSYHNGSVWPHDNAMIALGLARYNQAEQVGRILTGIFDVALFSDLHRLPELFCGFERRPGKGPTLYPVACSPQSWAAGAVFMLLKASIGLHIDSRRDRVVLEHPSLPESLPEVTIRNLRLDHGKADIVLERYGDTVALKVPRREGNLEILVVA